MWTFISKNVNKHQYSPPNLLWAGLDAKRIGYEEASSLAPSYWKDKKVLFQCVWAKHHPRIWLPYYKQVAESAKFFITEIDSDAHFNNLHTLDKAAWGTPLLFWNILEKNCNNFIWELPIECYPFLRPVNLIPIYMFDKSQIKKKVEKEIDVLGFVDAGNSNISVTMKVLTELYNQGYKVKCITISDKYLELYSDMPFPLVKNTKFNKKGQQTFWNLLEKSRVYLDCSTRLTMGRNAYEALQRNAIPVISNTYGSCVLGYSFDALRLNLEIIISLVEEALTADVAQYQERAHLQYNIHNTIKEVKNASEV